MGCGKYKPAALSVFIVLSTGLFAQTPAQRLPQAPSELRGAPSGSTTRFRESSVPLGATDQTPCHFHGLAHHAWIEAGEFGRGVANIPRGAIRPSNLKWELPVGATTGILIAEGDQPLANRIQGRNIQHIARFWSNFGLGVEIASGGLAYAAGCAEHRTYLRDTGLTVLDALAAAGVADFALKLAFDRQFPYTRGSTGKFWGGGRSFPSGHSASSFAFAAAIAHRYPDKRWLKWAAYGLATGVALSRYPAKRHYASDILAGSALGYVTGAYMAGGGNETPAKPNQRRYRRAPALRWPRISVKSSCRSTSGQKLQVVQGFFQRFPLRIGWVKCLRVPPDCILRFRRIPREFRLITFENCCCV